MRLRHPFAEVTLVRRADVRPEERGLAADASSVLLELPGWLLDPVSRQSLVAMLTGLRGPGGGASRASDLVRIGEQLAEALRRGDLVALSRPVRRVIRTLTGVPQPLGPRDTSAVLQELRIQVLDSTGAPLVGDNAPGAGLLYFAKLSSGESKRDSFDAQATAVFDDLDPGTCYLTLTNIEERPKGTVPPDAPPFEQTAGARLITRDNTEQLDFGTTPKEPKTLQLLQLERREATVFELEHFLEGSAVFLPGLAPATVPLREEAARVQGIDALRACLTFANGYAPEQILVTGHAADVAQERADNVKALLVADRDAWVNLTLRHSAVADYQHVLTWAATHFGWACDPGAVTNSDNPATHEAIHAFQASYNADMAAGLFPESNAGAAIDVDGVVGKQTWGAMFDCYIRGVRPVAAPPAPAPGTYPIGDDGTRTGRNAGRPTAQYPFVVLGRNGPGNAPITIALYGSGSENNYMQLQPMNPQYRIGREPEFVGQALNVPWEWADKLLNSGYTVEQDPISPAPPVPPADPGPPPIAKPGPKATGCGAHHLITPFASVDRRRSTQRAVEVTFFDAGEAVPRAQCGVGDGACSAAKCELYDPREFTLAYMAADAGPVTHSDLLVRVPFDLEEAQTLPHVFVLESQTGGSTRKSASSDATAGDDGHAQIRFTGLQERLAYRLRVEGVAEPYALFELTPYPLIERITSPRIALLTSSIPDDAQPGFLGD